MLREKISGTNARSDRKVSVIMFFRQNRYFSSFEFYCNTFLSFSFSCTCTNCSALWRTSTRWVSATGTSSHRTYCWTRNPVSWSSVISVRPNTWSKASPMCLTFAVVTIARLSSSLVPSITPQKLVRLRISGLTTDGLGRKLSCYILPLCHFLKILVYSRDQIM